MKIPKISTGEMIDAPEAEECVLHVPSWAVSKKFFTHAGIEDRPDFVCAEGSSGCVVGRGDTRELADVRE